MDTHGTLPKSIIIIGAGVFGLSTALAVAKRHPSVTVTVVDRAVPPVADGESVDTTRCIRADYDDHVYARLAKQAQQLIESDSELRPYLFKQGMTWVVDGKPGSCTDRWKTQFDLSVSSSSKAADIVVSQSREQVYQTIHGQNAQPPSASELGREPLWNTAYSNSNSAFIDAKEGIRVYYERCLKIPSVEFRCGVPVKKINVVDGTATGVTLADDASVDAELVIVAAGAWSNNLVYLNNHANPMAISVAWVKVTPEEEAEWKNMAITTNLSTGLNVFPPYCGEMKVLRRIGAFKNTVTVPHPEDDSRLIQISQPRTLVAHPSDLIPADAEAQIRDNLREIMPMIASRPFDRTRLCWRSRTPTKDFLITAHPRIDGIHIATGGSGHGWKFLPIIGDLILDSVEGKLPDELKRKWSFHHHEGEVQNDPHHELQELRHVVRSQVHL